MHAEWLMEAIRRDACDPNEWWIDHKVTQNERLRGRTVGSLPRTDIEFFAPKIEMLRERLNESGEDQTEAYRDLNALGQAGTVLDRLKELVKEQYQAQEQTEMPLKEPVTQPEPPASDFTETQLTESSNEAEATAELHEWEAGIAQISSDLLDPRFVPTVDAFLVVFDRARSILDQVRDPWQLKQISDIGEKLTELSKLFDLGRRQEMRGKALRFDALYKASQLFSPGKAGRPQNGQEAPPVVPFDEPERKMINVLRPWEPQDYQHVRDEAIKAGTLSDRTFKKTPAPKPPKTSNYDPRRFLYDFLADMRTNLELSYRPDQIMDWANDPIVLENLGPIADRFATFAMNLAAQVKRKYEETASSTTPEPFP